MEALEFGQYLKVLRKKKKMTIRQLELYSGVSNAYLSQLENGKRGIPSPDIMRKLYKPLGTSYEELMSKAGHLDLVTRGYIPPMTNDWMEKNKQLYSVADAVNELAEKYNFDLADPELKKLLENAIEVALLMRKQQEKQE